jgi:hypothetical protein
VNWDLVVVGLTIALSPISVVAMILLIATERGAAKGAAFLVGWVLSLLVIIGGTIALTGGQPPRQKTAPGTGASIATIVVGVILLGVALRAERRRREGLVKPKKEPKWMAKVDNMSLLAAATLGCLLQPWGLMAAGVATAIDVDTSNTSSVVSVVLFGLLATSTLLIMEGWVALRPTEANRKLAAMRTWTQAHRNHVVVVLSTVVGVMLIAKGAHQL